MTTETIHDHWEYRRKASAFSELGGADVAGWTPITLPHDAMLGENRRDDLADGATTGHFPSGAYQYRRSLNVPVSAEGDLVTLVFEGVYRHAAVFVNGALVTQRPNGYAEFEARIDPYLRFGEDNEILVECRTGKDSRWYSGAGIYRPVHLRIQPPLHLAQTRFTTLHLDTEQAQVELAAVVRNDGPTTVSTRLRATLTAEGEHVAGVDTPVTILPGEEAVVRRRMLVPEPRGWSDETPFLYDAEVTLDGVRADTVRLPVGLRVVRVDPVHGLRVNGRQVKLRGACVHHDNGVLGAATFAGAEDRRVRLLKEAGFNALRSAHNPMSRAMLAACDRHGVYVMDEAFDMWTVSKTDEDYSAEFPQWWQRDLESMVLKDLNHPSVILYSIGNEIPENGTPFGGVQSRHMAEKVRQLDPSRLVTNGINGFVATLDDVLAAMRAQASAAGGDEQVGGGVNTMMAQLGTYMNLVSASEPVTVRTEESQAVLDVAGMNYAEGRYELDRDRFPDRVIVGTESFPTHIDQIWRLVTADPRVIGDFTWTGWDYLGEAGIGGVDYAEDADASASVARSYPWLLAYCGDIDITGHRRPASYYREIVFGLRTAPYIAVQPPRNHGKQIAFATPWAWGDTVASWTWPGYEGEPVHLEVYADADEVALLLDGIELQRSPVGTDREFRADFDTVYRPGALEAVAYRRGVEVGRDFLRSAGTGRRITTTVEDGNDELTFIRIELTDDLGITVTGEDRLLGIRIEGPAILQGLGSANPKTEESYLDAEHTTFDGRALAVLRRTGPGPVTLFVDSAGLETAAARVA